MYSLSLFSRSPETGYSIMQTIDEKTDGAWRPGPGTVYPMLRSMVKEGLVKPVASTEKEISVVYGLTQEGKKELEEMLRSFAHAGRKQQVMIRLFADLFPAISTASFFVSRQRDMFDIFREAIVKIPSSERAPILKELRSVLEIQSSWVDAQLSTKTKRVR